MSVKTYSRSTILERDRRIANQKTNLINSIRTKSSAFSENIQLNKEWSDEFLMKVDLLFWSFEIDWKSVIAISVATTIAIILDRLVYT